MCRYRSATCHSCATRNASRKPEDKTKWVEVEPTDKEELHLFTIGERASMRNQIIVQVQANGQQLSMELDTGAAVSIISQDTKESLFPDVPLQHSQINLHT